VVQTRRVLRGARTPVSRIWSGCNYRATDVDAAAMMVPTIDGWIEQWYGPPPVLMDIGWLEAPAAISPVSSDPLFKTTRCVTRSTLRHTTV
jgi:hypothetical protein